MTTPLRLELPGAMYHTTGRGSARAAIYAAAADRATVLILFLGRDKATLVDKERAFSALSTLRRMPRLSSHVPIVPAAETVHSHGHMAPNGERARIPMEQ